MNKKSYFSIHNHTSYSNLRLRDAIIKVPELLDNGLELGLNGLAITDHETLSAHVKAKQYFDKNKERFGDFKLAFGNEIYLVDKKIVNESRENNDKIFFNHFILLAKNKHGYEMLMNQSTKAWENSFFYRGMERVPTYYDELSEMMKDYKGDIIASSACLGGIIPKLILKYHETKNKEDYDNIISELRRFVDIFGVDDFYLELQPSNHEEQEIVNDYLVKIAHAFGLKIIVTTDSHYLSKEQKEIHKIYLQSNGDDGREVDDFYDTTYQMSASDLSNFFGDENLLQEMFDNTNSLMEKIEDFDFGHATIIPQAHIPNFNPIKLTDIDANIDWTLYPSIQYYESSSQKADLYYLKLIMEGLANHNQELSPRNLKRIDEELDVVKAIGDNFGMPMSSYFLADREFVDIMWKTSLVGVARGSASSFYTNYLLDLVQINALDYDLPYWRFLNKDRLDNMPDLDTDAESSQRENIINNVKERFGEHNVINIGTFTTEGTRSAVLTATRGVGMNISESNNLLDMIPNEKGINWPLHDVFFGSDSRQPVEGFIEEVQKYPYLKETMLAIEGIVSGRSQHASGVVVMNDGYTKHFPAMKTKNGLMISQFEAHDVEFVGGLKFDFLSISALGRIRSAMDLLVKNNKIEWQGDLKSTYDKYLHPDNINPNSPELFKSIYANEVPAIFQFNTNVGLQGLQKVHPENFDELAATNSLIRLTTSGEQPIDKYIKFKSNQSLWFDEMKESHLSEKEMDVLKNILIGRYGIADTQELLMILSMDENISNFSLKQANKLRKSVAKKDPVLQQKEKILFFDMCAENGTSEEMANYVWNFCIVPQFGYAFSLPHIIGYTLIAIIEAYIATEYGSIYWKTASLSVDAGIQGEEFEGVDYVKLSRAVTNAKNIVELPDINRSEIGFTPNKNRILFGLGAISGIGLNDINTIIDNRPYTSFMDFMNKVGDNFSQKKIIALIKSGIFHEFVESTRELAIKYLYKYTERKKKLTTVQLPKIINEVPAEYTEAKDMYIFKSKVFGRNAIPMNQEIEKEFFEVWEPKGIDYSYEDGKLVIDKKSFDKTFNKFSEHLKEWLKTDDAINALAKVDMAETWNKEFEGNEAQWYFEELSYYPYQHQLLYTDLTDIFDIINFKELPENGDKSTGRMKYEKGIIAGTVIDKDKRGLVTVVTPDDEVVMVRIGKQRFGKYNKKIMEGTGKNRKLVEDSWFVRGTRLMFSGYRRENDFIANKYGTGFNHCVMKLDGTTKISVINR